VPERLCTGRCLVTRLFRRPSTSHVTYKSGTHFDCPVCCVPVWNWSTVARNLRIVGAGWYHELSSSPSDGGPLFSVPVKCRNMYASRVHGFGKALAAVQCHCMDWIMRLSGSNPPLRNYKSNGDLLQMRHVLFTGKRSQWYHECVMHVTSIHHNNSFKLWMYIKKLSQRKGKLRCWR
jgi:hypothetical protein